MLTRKMITGMVVILLVSMGGAAWVRTNYAEVGTGANAEDNVKAPSRKYSLPQPAYKPNEIIVKFNKPAAETLEKQLSEGTPVVALKLSASLDNIGRKYNVMDIKPVIKNFKAKRQRIENLLKKDKKLLTKSERHLVRRLKRAPKGARVPDLGRIYKIELEEGQSAPLVVAEYNKDRDVEYAELNYVVSICLTPDDPNYSPEQWALNNTAQSYPVPSGGTESGTADCDIDAPEAWDINTGSSDVIVAVIDTGVDYNHADLAANMWTDANGCFGYDFVNDDNDPMDDNGHGTHCSGTIGAVGDNNEGIAGVCWNVKIMAVKSFNANGIGFIIDCGSAIYYAEENGADVTSNSWGGEACSKFLEDAIDYAYSQGVVMIAAAGNNNSNAPSYPAYYDYVMAVAATDSNDDKASFSNYGDWIDVAAPGVHILSLHASGTDMYGDANHYYPHGDANATMYIASGTSMACPHVAGLAALCLAEEANLIPGDVRLLIKLNADDVNDPNLGSGRINAYKTLNAIPPNFPDPNKAANPDPPDDSNFISINTYLSWTADEWATSHDVYLGTDFNDVNDANTSSEQFQGNVLVPPFEPNTLDTNSTYYWRIDTRNYNACTKGDVWSFTTRDGSIIYVDADANDGGDCLSWENACNCLEDALAIAVNDEIWVAEGTYTPDSNDRSDGFAPGENIKLYGGFAGTESSRDERDPNLSANITILSGDINEPNDANDNCYHVITGNDNLVLDRFTITGGNANGSYPNCNGAGMLNVNISSITITDCVFTENDANNVGGGMLNGFAGVITLGNCKFTANAAKNKGGGMFNQSSILVVTDSTFNKNVANQQGGGMYNHDCSVTVNNCIFSENAANLGVIASGGAGMYNYWYCSPIVNNCTFSDNDANFCGGGMYNYYYCCPIVNNCIFIENNANFYGGGGMYNGWCSSPTVKNCVFSGNSASMGGGIWNEGWSSPAITNCTFSCNVADSNGGAMGTIWSSDPPWFSDPIVTNSVFWADEPNEIYNDSHSNPTFSFCDIEGSGAPNDWDPNLGNNGGGNIDIDPCFANIFDFADITTAAGTTTTIEVNDASLYDVNDVIEYDNDSTARTVTDVNTITDIVTFSNALDANSVSGVLVYNWGIGATDVNEDLHLTSDSNCIDAGDPNGDYSGEKDIDGQDRVYGAAVDIGADETNYVCPTCMGDVDGDGYVAFSDLSELVDILIAGDWYLTPTTPGWNPCGDMDADDDLDSSDADELEDYLEDNDWFIECP